MQINMEIQEQKGKKMNKTTKKKIDYFIYLTDNMPLTKNTLKQFKKEFIK